MTIRRAVGELAANAYAHSWEAGGQTRAVLIDPGASGFALARLILDRGWVPEAIVLTHGHFDHIGGLGEARSAFAAAGFSVPVAIHSADARFLGPGGGGAARELLAATGDWFDLPPAFDSLPPADILLEDGDAIGSSPLRVIHTPGHSPGSICLRDAAERSCFTGDTLFAGGVGRADFPGSDPAALERSLSRLRSLLEPDCLCRPGHGGETRAAEEWRWIFG